MTLKCQQLGLAGHLADFIFAVLQQQLVNDLINRNLLVIYLVHSLQNQVFERRWLAFLSKRFFRNHLRQQRVMAGYGAEFL